jgi:chitodextrinase
MSGKNGSRRWLRLLVVALASCLMALTVVAPASADPVIGAVGDIACDPLDKDFNGGNGAPNNDCRQKYTSDLMLDANGTPTVDRVLTLGDNQYYCGGIGSWDQSYALSWGRQALKAITTPVPGNHEYLTTGTSTPTTGCDATNGGATGYFNYFGTSFGTSGNPSKGYYSYDLGSWHIVALNSSCTGAGGCNPTSPQGKWLRADLAEHTNDCTLAYWHIPLFSSGGRASATYKTFWDALYQYGADVVLNGHDHTYERFAPQTPTGARDDAMGIRQWVVGSGGANHTAFVSIAAANSEERNSTVYGILRLTLHPSGYSWQFAPEVRDAGLFTDSGTTSCHGAPDVTPPTAPGNLAASASDPHQVDLSWTASTDNVGVTEYRIFRDGATTPIGTSTTTSFADTTVVPTTTYSYTVKAYDDAGNESPASNTVTTTTPAVGGGVLTFLPVADAYVDEASPTTNRGTSTQLRIDGAPNVHGYLKFDVQGVSQAPTSAVLRVFANSSSTTGHDVRGATDTSWTETGITYATRPAFGSVAGTSGAFTSGRYVEVPVTSLVTGNGLLTLVMTGPGATAISYASREVAANPPQLVVNTAP